MVVQPTSAASLRVVGAATGAGVPAYSISTT